MLSRVWLLALVAICLCGFSWPSRGQTPTPTPAPLRMALSSPFARSVKPFNVMGRGGKWVPIAVTLSNTGEPVSGQVQLQLAPVQGGSFQYPPNTYTVDVELPTNSSKRVWLYARLDRPDVGGFDVSFSGRGFGELRERVPVTLPDPEQREVMIVSDTDIGLDDTLRALQAQALLRSGGKAPNNNFTTGLRPVEAFPFGKELVPDRWIGFESADMVVLGDFPHIALSPTQIDALRGYVQGGGTLIVMGGANAARLSSSPLKDLWPMVPSTSVSASSSEVADLVSQYVDNPQNGGDRLGGAPVVVTRGSLTQDAVLRVGTLGQPLWAQRDVGAGRVSYLSFDPSQPPFKGWKGQSKLWRELFVQSSQLKTLETVDDSFLTASYSNFGGGGSGFSPSPYYSEENVPSSLTEQLLQSLSHAEQLIMPPVSRIAWFLALYVFFLVPLNYAVLRIIDRRELAWVTIPVIVVVFSLWAYTEALSIRGRAILTRQMDVVQSTIGSRQGRVDTLFWLFSPRRTTYDVSTVGQNAALSDYANTAGGEQGEFSITQPLDGSSFKVDGAPIRMWTDRAFASQSLGNLKQGLSLSGNTIRNGLGIDLYGLVWVQDKQVRGLGALKDGASASLVSGKSTGEKFGVDVAGAIIRASQLDEVFDKSSRANNIPHSALIAALGSGFGKNNTAPMLLAWGKRSLAPISIGEDNGQGRQMTLFIFRAPKLPPQLAASEATVQRIAFEPFVPGQSPLKGGFAFFDCDQVPNSKSLSLQIRGTGMSQYSAQMYASPSRFGSVPPVPLDAMVQFEVWNVKQARWQLVPGQTRKDPSPAGGWVFRAPVSSQWVRRPNNTLRVRVRLANAGAQISSVGVSA